MSIPSQRISKVIIGGEWFSVEMGTFKVEDFILADDNGEPLHESLGVQAYRFTTTNRDEYYGPLAAIELIKLLNI